MGGGCIVLVWFELGDIVSCGWYGLCALLVCCRFVDRVVVWLSVLDLVVFCFVVGIGCLLGSLWIVLRFLG